MGDGIDWSLMIMILTMPKMSRGRVYHTFKKFSMPESIIRFIGLYSL